LTDWDGDQHNETMETDDDPEFNYIAEAETEEQEAEEDQFHGPFRVSSMLKNFNLCYLCFSVTFES
jgi:hypothetical protein